jgi:protein-S-isoprenylcysteine O-methyltransferase Ste14
MIRLGAWQFAAAPSHGAGLLIGAVVVLSALAVAIYAYFALGIENTYGADDGLVTTGLYRYSRNPQFVASIAGFAGLALAASSAETLSLCVLAIKYLCGYAVGRRTRAVAQAW